MVNISPDTLHIQQFCSQLVDLVRLLEGIFHRLGAPAAAEHCRNMQGKYCWRLVLLKGSKENLFFICWYCLFVDEDYRYLCEWSVTVTGSVYGCILHVHHQHSHT